MIKTPDESLKIFKDLIEKKYDELSETDTRSKIIDHIFIECLNWNENDITREKNTKHAGFIDYVFKKGDTPLFIIEAKKKGISFSIPPNFKSRNYKISATISQCKDLIKAIEQAQKYCIDEGIQYAIVTNGHQYVIFEAFKSGASWRDGKCVVFHSLKDIELNFTMFFKYLNKNSVSKGTLRELLGDENRTYKFLRPLDKIPNKDMKYPRNYLHKYISPIIDIIFGPITDPSQIDILKKCYVYDKAYKETGNDIKQLYYDRIPHYAMNDEIRDFIETEKTAGFFQECVNIVRKNNEKGTVIALQGGIGSGKTTFIHRFFNIILKGETDNIWFYVDFKTAPADQNRLEDYVYEKIIIEFDTKYLPILKSDLKKRKITLNNSKENKEEYVTQLLCILRLIGYPVTLILDNVDRCSRTLQERIFIASQRFADKFLILTLLALREESYVKSKLLGTLDAYYIKKFHIRSPKFEKLILNRIDYLLKLLEKSDKDIEATIGRKIDLGDKKEEIKAFFEIIKTSMQRNRPDLIQPITHFITCVSEGNMREGLEMFNNFLSSGNTKVSEMMEVTRKGEKYFVSDYQFLKSAILTDSKYYRGDKSYIMNLFELNAELTSSHFLPLRILGYAYGRRSIETIDRGFVSINKLLQEADDVFINQEAIVDVLGRLGKYGLITFDNQSKEYTKDVSYYHITATGTYYFKKLLNKFIYIDLVHPDTPIADVNVYKELKRRVDQYKLDDRIKRSMIFLKYLQEMEKQEFKNHPEYLTSDLTRFKFMNNIIYKYTNETQKIIQKPRVKKLLQKTKN